MAKDPDKYVHEVQREKNLGIVCLPSNSHAATSNFYVDRSRLRTHQVDEWNPVPFGSLESGHVVKTETDSIMDNARRAAGEMGVRGSFKNETDKPRNCWDNLNPITRKRGDDV